MFRSSHNDIVDYGLEEIIARTEESLKEEEVKNSDEEMAGPQVVPHPIDLLYFMELKEEEDKGTKQKRRRSKQTKLKPVRIKQTPATGNQYEEDGADGFQSSKDQDEHWPDVYSKAVPGTTQTTRRSLPELPGSGRQMSPPEPARGPAALSPTPTPLPGLLDRPDWSRGGGGGGGDGRPATGGVAALLERAREEIGQQGGDLDASVSLESLGGSLSLASSAGGSALSLCSDAPPPEAYRAAGALLLQGDDKRLLGVVGGAELAAACRSTGADRADVLARCRAFVAERRAARERGAGGAGALLAPPPPPPGPILVEALAYLLWEAGRWAREEEAAQRATEAAAAAAAAAREQHPGAGTAAERQRNYLLSQLRKTESMAEEETTKAEKSMNRAWSAVEKANQVVEERRRAIQEKINARDKRLADLAARKAREKLEKEEQIQSHFDFVKKRQEMKKKQDVERLTQVEQQLAVKDRMIDEQINRANQERIAKTTEMSERRNNKSRQARGHVTASEYARRRRLGEQVAAQEAAGRRREDEARRRRARRLEEEKERSEVRKWHAERRRRAADNRKVARLGEVKGKLRFLRYDANIAEALARERGARQKAEVVLRHQQAAARERMAMSVSPGPGEYDDGASLGSRPARGGAWPRDTATGFLKNALSADQLLSPGPGHYQTSGLKGPSGGQFSTAFPKTALEWEMYRASRIPGPADYMLPDRKIGGGHFSPDEISKSQIDRIMAHSKMLPSPTDYAPEANDGPRGNTVRDLARQFQKQLSSVSSLGGVGFGEEEEEGSRPGGR